MNDNRFLSSYNKTLLNMSFDDGYIDAQNYIKYSWNSYVIFTVLALKALYLVVYQIKAILLWKSSKKQADLVR